MWRQMRHEDLSAVGQLAEDIHVNYPEDAEVFAERLRLYPRGCRVYERDGRKLGYVLSHPWVLFAPPSLNALLGALPEESDTYYLHDLALLPEARGTGAAAAIVSELIDVARREGFSNLSLVAVNHSAGFWRKMGWRAALETEMLRNKLASYGADAAYMVYEIGRVHN